MKSNIIIIVICILQFSCSSFLNNEQRIIEIHTIPDSITICLNNDTCIKSPLCIEVPRSYKDFNILVKHDSIEKSIRIHSRIFPNFKRGNILMPTYNNSILIDLNNNINDYEKWKPNNRKQFYVRGSLPWFNFVKYNNGIDNIFLPVFGGGTIGLDYYHSKHSYLTVNGGATGISEQVVPAFFTDYIDTVEFLNTYNIKLTNNHNFYFSLNKDCSFNIGYGLSFSNYNYEKVYIDTVNLYWTYLQKNRKSTLGFCFDANLQIFKYYFIGINFIPSIYTINNKKIQCSYLTYVDFGARLPLKKNKKTKYNNFNYKPNLIE